jgi:hypothetical protein
MAQKWIGAYGKDMQRGCVYQLLAAAVVIPLVCLFIFIPLYMANRPGVTESEALLIMVISGVLFLLLIFGGSALTIILSIRRRAGWMDAAFDTFNLEGSSYAMTGRQYHGQYRGREMDVSFLRGPLLQIHLSTDLMTRMTISDSQSVLQELANLIDKEPIQMEDDQLIAYPHELEWAKPYLDDPQVRSLLVDLVFDDHPFLIRQVEFQPGTTTLRLYRSNNIFDFKVLPEQVRKWVSTLLELIEISERQPAPAEILEPSALATNVREGKTARYAWLIIGAIAGISVCVGIIGVTIALLVQ